MNQKQKSEIEKIKKTFGKESCRIMITNWTFSLPIGWVSLIILYDSEQPSVTAALCEEGKVYAGSRLDDAINRNIGAY
ncbi:hypothetical protein CL629_02835 [bacterium]|nr:hypothetical protein [bacterium]